MSVGLQPRKEDRPMTSEQFAEFIKGYKSPHLAEAEKIIQSLQNKLQQAKEGLEFYEQGKHIERTSYPDIGNNTKCIKLLSTGDYLEVENGLKARETLEIINKE